MWKNWTISSLKLHCFSDCKKIKSSTRSQRQVSNIWVFHYEFFLFFQVDGSNWNVCENNVCHKSCSSVRQLNLFSHLLLLLNPKKKKCQWDGCGTTNTFNFFRSSVFFSFFFFYCFKKVLSFKNYRSDNRQQTDRQTEKIVPLAFS